MSAITRQLVQVEGYESDYQWDLATTVIPTLTRPADCPVWALAFWEAVLRLPSREIWSAPQRRASIEAYTTQAVQQVEVAAFIAAQARCAATSLTFTVVGYQVNITTSGLSTAEVDAVKAAAGLVIPAHMKFAVDGVVIR